MQQARIILADEPVASLDPVTAEQILALLKTLQQEEKLTVVMNSHNTRQAVGYAERIIGLKQGVVIKDAAVSDWDEESFAAVYGGTK
jgi:phosphonate transport system ATP-binding protein